MLQCVTIGRVMTFAALALAAAISMPRHGGAQMPPNKTEIGAYKGLFSTVIRADMAATQKLLAEGANPNVKDDKGRTPLHIAAHRRNAEMARVLVKGGADPRARDGRGYDIIAIAAVQDDANFIPIALELGADPKATIGTWGGTALNTAAQLGHADVVKALVKAGSPVNRRNKAGWTPLIEAIVLGQPNAELVATVKALLDGGADPNIADSKGITPLALAKKRGFTAIPALLVKAGGK